MCIGGWTKHTLHSRYIGHSSMCMYTYTMHRDTQRTIGTSRLGVAWSPKQFTFLRLFNYLCICGKCVYRVCGNGTWKDKKEKISFSFIHSFHLIERFLLYDTIKAGYSSVASSLTNRHLNRVSLLITYCVTRILHLVSVKNCQELSLEFISLLLNNFYLMQSREEFYIQPSLYMS